MPHCLSCDKGLTGRQRKFCSRACKNKYNNYQYQSCMSQQSRGRERKLRLVQG